MPELFMSSERWGCKYSICPSIIHSSEGAESCRRPQGNKHGRSALKSLSQGSGEMKLRLGVKLTLSKLALMETWTISGVSRDEFIRQQGLPADVFMRARCREGRPRPP